MAPLLAKLANLSFSTVVFPAGYKLGRVIPLLRKAGLPKDDPANYRPITNLPTFSKLLERLALNRLQPHVLASGNFCCSQSAYRSGYSTETSLLKIVNDIRVAVGEGKCTVLPCSWYICCLWCRWPHHLMSAPWKFVWSEWHSSVLDHIFSVWSVPVCGRQQWEIRDCSLCF